MVRKREFLIGLLAILLPFCVQSETNSDDEVTRILEDIQNEYQNLEIGEQKNFVMVLGNTGTGKTTLALLLSGAKLRSVRVSRGVFRIEDDGDKISGNSTTVSKTKVPNLIYDSQTNTTLYDCPGFADSRGVVIDITATLSIHDLLKYAETVKFLFAVSYDSVANSIGDRRNFRELAGHVVNLIKNVEKYAKGMGLVVTKVQNIEDYDEHDNKILVDDASIIESIADFLRQTKNDLEKRRTEKMTNEERRINEEKIKFTEIFLEREGDTYTRINIFRLADRPGPLEKIELIQKEKEAINEMLDYNLDYVPAIDEDFGYPLSDESKGHVNDLLDKLDEQLEKYSTNICNDLRLFYSQNQPLADTVAHVRSEIGVDNLFSLKSNSEFIIHLRQSLTSLGIQVNADTFENLLKSAKFSDFLNEISKDSSSAISGKIETRLNFCADELFDDVKAQLRINVPNAIVSIRDQYIKLAKSEPKILESLGTFLSVGLSEPSVGINSTALRLLQSLNSDSSNDQFKRLGRNTEFLDFLQMLTDKTSTFSVKVSHELKASVGDIQQELENSFSTDILSIFDAIRDYSYQKEKQNYLNFEKVQEIAFSINKTVSRVNSGSLQVFLDTLFGAVNDLNIGSAIGSQVQISRKFEFFKLLTQADVSVPEEARNNLDDCKKDVNDTLVWYSFLLDLRIYLLRYGVQQSNLRNEGTTLLTQSITEEHGHRRANEIGLQPILASLNRNDFTSIIDNMKIDANKLKAVQALWSEMMSDFHYTCTSNELIVKGHVISISKIVALECWSRVKSIDVLVTNRILVDADINKNGEQAELSIIAPTWQIVLTGTEKERHINIEGAPGLDSKTVASDNTNGVPGKPGGAGGNFLAIGNEFNFRYGTSLIVNTKGGSGGSGQNGGKGTDGTEGESPPRPPSGAAHDNFVKRVMDQGFRCEHQNRDRYVGNGLNGFDDYEYHTCYGKAGTRGLKGGDGGCGGYGGSAGIVVFDGLEKTSPIQIFNETGGTGIKGQGGLGGKETRNGRTYEIETHGWNRVFYIEKKKEYSITKDEAGPIVPAGDTGGYGTNCDGIEERKKATFNISPHITRYQEYARENLENITSRSNLEHLLDGLTNSVSLDSYFSIVGLIEEFNSLESQYFHLHKSISMTPFYQSLKHRTERYVRQIGESVDERESVKILYTTIITKLLSIENRENQIVVNKLLTYIDVIKEDIAQLNEDKRVEFITEYRDDYKDSLDAKMKSANELVQSMVVPAIDKTFSETEDNIQELLKEAIVKHNETEEALEKAKENKRRLEKSMLWHNILAPLKVIGGLLSLAGPKGAIAGAVLSGGASFAESVIDGGLQPQKIKTPPEPYKKLIQKITNNYMRQQVLFIEQLSDLDKILGEANSTDFDEMRRVVQDVTIQVNVTVKFDKALITDVSNKIKTGKLAINSVIDSAKWYFNDLKKRGQDVTKHLDRIQKIEKLMKVSDVGVDIYKQNREDNGKLDAINQQIKDLHDQLNTWKQYEENIKEIMLPQLKEIEGSFDRASKDLSGKSHVELDISKWKIQGALSDLKKLFGEMAKAQESLLEGDLLHCIDKVTEGITTMITVYDRIDSYAEKSKLVSLISDVAIGVGKIKNETLRNAALNLDKILRTNFVLERFEAVMQALKQHKFPFARRYLEVFYKLPANLQSNDTANVVQMVTDNIDFLRKQIVISQAALEIPDINTFSDQIFDASRPFYVWDHQNYQDDIHRLIDGERVTLRTDVTKGVNFTAVKFKEIAINLKLANATRQNELNAMLEKYEIVMTMVGNNYYRCNNRIYYVPMDKNVVLIFRIKDGKVVDRNDIYTKIYESDYFLSPYTVWNIQLTTRLYTARRLKRSEQPIYAPNDLRKFKNERIDLQLMGVGQIIKNKVKNELNMCNNDLDNYYALDKIF